MAEVQVITGPERRRRWSVDEKRAIVAAAGVPGAVVRAVARRADVSPSLIYRWRREFRTEGAGFAEMVCGFGNQLPLVIIPLVAGNNFVKVCRGWFDLPD